MDGIGNDEWYRNAVFYEVMVRGFRDSNGDGIGDLPGVIEKLDHFEWLGVDCLWLLPFFQSPLRDNGYDISDYLAVHPDFGETEDLGRLLDEAHRRGIRVIADLVVNHTSDQHPWFIESRSSRTNAKADWYVWDDDPERYPDARIIFIDTETSNWAWDPTRRQYYWHRFFSHQPDLNFDCPEVSEAMFDVMAAWLERGLDGFRLDAVPYLFERDGTNCENLPETHQWLKRLRSRVDEHFPGRILLAEANQPPAEVVEYFGDGDECHMAFHFPLMPLLYRALRDQRGATIGSALDDTPAIPDGSQWGVFLRNHDELTLEMVTPDEYQFLVAQYAPDPRMVRNVGIGRRLFPLIGDDRRQAELLHCLLLSLPGSPVLYYGDEIGMGERLELDDRDPVRTPMQWDGSPNGGFSSASPSSLYLPSIMDGPYGFLERNVADQSADPESFLCWLRTLIVVRSELGVFGTGSSRQLVTAVQSVFALERHHEDRGTVWSVVNLADTAVVVEDLILSDSATLVAARDADIGSGTIRLGPFGWAWIRAAGPG